MRKAIRIGLVVAMVGAGLMVGTATASALTNTYTGTINTSDPTMPVVGISTPVCTTQLVTPVHYDVIELLHPLPGIHSFAMTSTGTTPGFASAYLYEGSFDPTNPLENCVAADNGADPVEITYDFLRGTPYFLVVFDDQFAQPGGDYEVVEQTPNPSPSTVGLVNPANAEWHLLNQVGAVTNFIYGNPGDFPMSGDWNCDGIDTPGLYRQSDGFVYLRNSNSQGIANIRFFFGNPGDLPLAGDFDGDGCDTVSIYRASEARIYVINELGANDGGLGAADFSFLFGNQGDKPFVGDFDGNGVDSVGLHRESTGFVYFRNTLNTGNASNEFFFGDPGDRFVAGDWGVVDRVATPGLFRPGNTTFYFRHTNTQGTADSSIFFGQASWLPVSGVFGLG
ncbi:MAG: hypothetical protein M3P87_08840 [Actinomycetota bacterium]|nr:hypothetical protein [Actinomycetota bacterium]